MTNIPKIKLNDGVEIPVYGFGTFQIPADGSTYKAVREALDLGIRHIDTAAAYYNEREVGQAIRDSGIARDEVFITSKLWIQDFGYEAAKKGVDASLRKLGFDYVDLYLLHTPVCDVLGAWKALEEAKAAGKIRSIGISNVGTTIWNDLVTRFDTIPSVNQIGFNPYCQQRQIRKLMAENGCALESWGPLGQGNMDLLSDSRIAKIAEAHGKQISQVILRFEVQEGAIIFPKSTNPERIRSNMDIFDFELTNEEMDVMRGFDSGSDQLPDFLPEQVEGLLKAFDVHADE